MTLPAAPHVEFLSNTDPGMFVEDWYDLADASHFWMRWRIQVIDRVVKTLRLDARASVQALDVGGGNGVVRESLERLFPFAVDCAELNMRALSHTVPGRGRTLFYDVTQRHSTLVGRYDVIFLLDVLEHVEPTRPFAEAIVDHLAPGGVLIVNVPALQWARSRYDDVVGHHRRYTKATLRAEFEILGLRVLDQRYWGLSLLPVLLARSLMLRFVPSDRIVTAGFKPPNRFANTVMTAVMKLETALLPAPPLGSSLLVAFGRPGSAPSPEK